MPYSGWKPCQDTPCRKCLSNRVNFRLYEPPDESYEDAQFKCVDCGHVWWVDGCDA
jgi:hypothetical protein